jgi:hypothetical protein
VFEELEEPVACSRKKEGRHRKLQSPELLFCVPSPISFNLRRNCRWRLGKSENISQPLRQTSTARWLLPKQNCSQTVYFVL